MTCCTCGEVKRPLPGGLPSGSNDRPRQWVVLIRNESRSAFNGYRPTWSDSSLVACRVCGSQWRTKAKFVDALPNSEFFPQASEPRVVAYQDL